MTSYITLKRKAHSKLYRISPIKQNQIQSKYWINTREYKESFTEEIYINGTAPFTHSIN